MLHIIGYGPNSEELKQLAKNLGVLDSAVCFLGAKGGQELVKHLQQSDFLFMFSHYENQPCVIMEAMACGKPVLATTVGGISEMVDAPIGLLSRPKNAEEMATLFERMLDTSSQYDPAVIRTVAEQKYGYEIVGKMISDVYSSVLG